MKWKRRASHIAVLAAIISGCAGGSDPVTSGSFVTDAAPLPTIERDIWELAPAGCEDVLSDIDVEFGIADAAPELVVVMGADGVLCVDSYSSLEADLVAIDPERMDALWLGYVAALQEVEAFSDPSQRSSRDHEHTNTIESEYDPREAQPQPQPSMGSPVSIEEAQVQPQPQPSDTGSGGPSTGNEGSDASNMHEGMDCPPGGGEEGPAAPPIL